MPRYYFDIYNSFVSIDDEGVELADDNAALEQVRSTLPALLKDVQEGKNTAQMRVDVRNEAGTRMASGTILMLIEATDHQDATRGVDGESQPRLKP